MQALRRLRRNEPCEVSAMRTLNPACRMTAKFDVDASFRVRQRSSSKVTSSVQWSFSTPRRAARRGWPSDRVQGGAFAVQRKHMR